MPESRGSAAPSSASRRASIGKRSTAGETSYAFLNFSHPSEAKEDKARRTVRSHVTRQQHQKEHQAAIAGQRSSSTPHSPDSTPQPKEEGKTHSASHARVGPVLTGQQSPVSTSNSPGSIVLHSPLNPRAPVDPRQLYPPAWIPYTNHVLDHYIASMANSTPDLTVESLQTLWMPFVFTDAALLHATLLIGTSFYGSPPGPRSHGIDVFELKCMTISAINESLQDPDRSISDQTIAAVLSLAQYEAFWGEARDFAFHMRAVQNMVHVRGGLNGISTSLQGLLEIMVLTIDYHSSRATGAEISFGPGWPRANYYNNTKRLMVAWVDVM